MKQLDSKNKVLENNVFIGRADSFSNLFLCHLQENAILLWLCDGFSLYAHPHKDSSTFCACRYQDTRKIAAQICQAERWNVWVYLGGLPDKFSINNLLKYFPSGKIQNLYFIIDKKNLNILHEYALRDNIYFENLNNIRFFIIPGLSYGGNSSVLDHTLYQIISYLSLIMSRCGEVFSQPIRVAAKGRCVHSLPINTLVESIMHNKKSEKKFLRIYDKYRIPIEEILSTINRYFGMPLFICVENVESPCFFENLFEEVLQICSWENDTKIISESDLPNHLSVANNLYESRIISAIAKVNLPQKKVKYQKKGVWSEYSQPLAYWMTREKRETIIIVNAFGAHRIAWDNFISYLQQYFRVIVWETPGCFSPCIEDSNSGAYCIESQVRDIERIVDKEKIQSFHLLAWCSGVKSAMIYASRHSSKVKSITVLSGDFAPFPNYKGNMDKFIANANLVSEIIDKKPKLLSIYLKSISQNAFGSEKNEKFFEAVPSKMHDVFLEQYDHPDWAISFLKMCMEQYDHDISSVIKMLDMPVLLLIPQYDKVIPYQHADWAIKQLSNGRVVDIPMATHIVVAEKPKEIVEIMLDQFRRIWE